MDLFKDIVASVLQTGKYEESSSLEEDYVPFVVNKTMSYHLDCLPYAACMNQYPNLDNRLQYDFFFYSIKKYKRPFKKWIKADLYNNVDNIKMFYGYSDKKAREVLSLLSENDLKYIKEKVHIGGKVI